MALRISVRWRHRPVWLIGLQPYNGLTAAAGGLALMSQTISLPPQLVTRTGFPRYLGGLILFAGAAGYILLTATGLIKRIAGA